MPDETPYDVWVINDPDGPVLYFPVESSSTASPGEHVTRLRQQAVRASAPEGLIEGVWSRARQRLAGPPDRLVAEIADPEVEPRRAAQRAATMARGADAAAWAPEDLLAEPEPAPRPAPRPRTPRPTTTTRPATRRKATPTRRTEPKAAPPPAEPEERVCPSCFMMRRTDQFTPDGVCTFCS